MHHFAIVGPQSPGVHPSSDYSSNFLSSIDPAENSEIHLEKHPDQQVLYKKNIGSGEDDKMIQRWNAFDPSHENIYFLVGNKVVKFPIGSCSLYEDCHSCLSATEDDPLGCGWCGDHCSHQQECETPDKFSTNSCSPLIYKVSPTSGPTEGGTLLTIWGDNFGSAHSGELQSNISISVAGMPCHIFLWQKDRVRCLLPFLQSCDQGAEGPHEKTYNSDLAPSDFILFPALKSTLSGRHFRSNEEVQRAVKNVLPSLGTDFYQDGFLKLILRCEKRISVGGEYVEK
ncbi:hypothetical protein AVEN_105388-1 [Araneus ventricosus]|uniref:PSI domain-containing protein n=1 Tax=Araneus ventricosus TaxID=182803 RepID=A0A4Y2UQR7_ARAVE|nr:hypothetical protein AVEN_252054-1 [Araneus ventricosus]GBO15337.1 hypothetical protein AVEN_105388-1 [Araneus ventricosus]